MKNHWYADGYVLVEHSRHLYITHNFTIFWVQLNDLFAFISDRNNYCSFLILLTLNIMNLIQLFQRITPWVITFEINCVSKNAFLRIWIVKVVEIWGYGVANDYYLIISFVVYGTIYIFLLFTTWNERKFVFIIFCALFYFWFGICTFSFFFILFDYFSWIIFFRIQFNWRFDSRTCCYFFNWTILKYQK